MFRAENFRDKPRIEKLVGLLFLACFRLVSDTEGLDSAGAGHLAHGGENRAGIQATTEEHSQWHFSHQPDPDAFLQQMPEFFDVLRIRAARGGSVMNVPIFLDSYTVRVDEHAMSRLQLEDVLEHRLRPRYIAQ